MIWDCREGKVSVWTQIMSVKTCVLELNWAHSDLQTMKSNTNRSCDVRVIRSRALWGSWTQKPFCVPHFLIIGNRLHSASLTFPEFQQADSNKQLLIRERTREEKSRETIVQPWGKVLVPSQGIHITRSLSCFSDTESPTRWEKLTVCCPQALRPQTGWNQKVDDADSHLPHHQPSRRMSRSWSPRPLWTITIKLLLPPSRSGHTVLRALARCGPLCLENQ